MKTQGGYSGPPSGPPTKTQEGPGPPGPPLFLRHCANVKPENRQYALPGYTFQDNIQVSDLLVIYWVLPFCSSVLNKDMT